MALFSGSKTYLDFSYDLRDVRDWKITVLRETEYLHGITALAVDATNGLLAFGSKEGKILVLGSPAATVVLHVSKPVKFLAFASLVFKLMCIDTRGTLYMWDLAQLGRPGLVTSEAYMESISCLATSPYHSHAFIGLGRGAVMTYDMLCMNRSPYIIPNLWTSHEVSAHHAKFLSSHNAKPSDLVDITIHPRDLNLLFISYAGGCVLYDLTERRPLHHYELILPPGAPGPIGYYDPDVMKPRRPALTSIAIHASGQLFVTGHADGSLAFWAVDDEEQPLMVRTIGRLDINYPEGEALDLALSNPHRLSAEDLDNLQLIPITKLSWSSFGPQAVSDPYTSSVLTVLGGIIPKQQTGVTTIRFPAPTLPTPSTQTQDRIHPDIRKSLTKTFSSMDRYTYSTFGHAIDFLLVPKESPHFGGNLDPKAVLILFEWPEGQHGVMAKEFPPPVFGINQGPATTPAPTSSTHKEVEDQLDAELSSALKSMEIINDPRDYTPSLPPACWTGMYAISGGDIVRLEKDEYELLQRNYLPSNSNVFSQIGRDKTAGIAWVDYGETDQTTFTKRQPHRLIATHHADVTVRFQDISAQLLIGSVDSPLPATFPAPLPHLTISFPRLLPESCIANARRPLSLGEAEIQSVQLTAESSECVTVMTSGHVFVFGLDGRQRHLSDFQDMHDDLIRLFHIPAEANTFQPTLMVENAWGSVRTAEMSDVGFLTIAYNSGALIVIDMRHPKIIFRDEGDKKQQRRISVALHMHNAEEEKQIVSLKWFVCGYDEDPIPRVRLLVSHRSGLARLFTLSQSGSSEWKVEQDVKKLEGVEHPLPQGSFILQAKTGASRVASRSTFREALQGGADPMLAKGDFTDEDAHCFWISAGEKGVKCQVNLTGGKVGRAEWGKGRQVECVQVVSRKGTHALVAAMDNREVIIYSLPGLEAIHIFNLPRQPNSAICFDDTGDFVDWIFDEQTGVITGTTLGTLFAMRRVYDEPVIDYNMGRRASPPMPPIVPLAPVSYLGSWFNFKKGKSGDAIDDLLAGPKRPIPPDAETSTIVSKEWQTQMQNRAQAIANQASKTGSNIYANLSTAVSERGEMLNGLQEQFSGLEEGGRKFMLEAKKMAAEQTGKRWFGF